MGMFNYECNGDHKNTDDSFEQDQFDFVDNVIVTIKSIDGISDSFYAKYDGYGRFELKSTTGKVVTFQDPTNEGDGGPEPGCYTGIYAVYCNDEPVIIEGEKYNRRCYDRPQDDVKSVIDISKYKQHN